MTGSVWQPVEPVEQQLSAARADGDVPAYLLVLARADLRLVMPAGGTGSWAVSRIEGRPCLVAFTSLPALVAVTGGAPHRVVRFVKLAADWPDPVVQLAVDPGLPIEAYLDAASVRDVAGLSAQPATPVETALARSLEAGDVEAYVAELMTGDVLMPLPDMLLSDMSLPDAAPAVLEPADPGFAWFRPAHEGLADGDDEPAGGRPAPIVAFTSWPRMCDLLGERRCVRLPFVALVEAWPDDAALLIDPGLRHGGRIDGTVMRQLGDEVRARMGVPSGVIRRP
jgi:hypothetical protein